MRIPALALGFALVFAALGPAAQAQDLVPQKRSALVSDTDLPGGDLQSIFNTTLEACERACLTDTRCTAFTFNTRNGACFPKAAPGKGVAYAGAISGRVLAAAAGGAARADTRKAELTFLHSGYFAGALKMASDMGRTHVTGDFTAADLTRDEASRVIDALLHDDDNITDAEVVTEGGES